MEEKFDINNELDVLHRILNNVQVLPFDDYELPCHITKTTTKNKYLLYILELTYEHPEIETYLKQLLKNFSVAELNNFHRRGYTILHYMICKLTNISLNSFGIIINLGINVNSQTPERDTPLHMLYNACIECEQNITDPFVDLLNIIGLFVKNGANINILNDEHMTVLDQILCGMVCELDESAKNIIMTFIDLGGKTNNPGEIEIELLEFVESYRSNNIKIAIKNEI